MRSIYQLTALIGNKSDGVNDERSMTAAWIPYAWMRREVIDCIPLPELPATVSKSAKTGRSVAAIYQPEEHFFTLRSFVFESGIRDTIEAEIMPYRQGLPLVVRGTVFLRELDVKAKPASGSPTFVGQLIDEVGPNDGRQPLTDLQRTTTQQAGELVDFLCVPDRWLPVVVVSQAKNPALGQNGYLVDGRELASNLVGSAHVMAVDWDVAYEFSQIVGDEWPCFGDTVRIYWPGLFDFETDNPYVHPLYTAQIIRRNFYPSQSEKELKKIIRARNVEQVTAWNRFGTRFYVEAEQMRMLSVSGEESTEELLKQCREQCSYVVEQYEKLRQTVALIVPKIRRK